LWASRREQTLLCLLPGVPQGARLNRWLALHLARMVLLVLALLLIVVWVLVRFANAYIHGGKYDELPLAMVVLAAPWMFLLWKNWAHARAPLGNAAGQVVLGMAVVGGLAAAWVFGLDRPWYELAALTLLLMLPLGWWRWRVISRAPVAWPVGRLG
jgi:hypothetical protein